MSRNVKPEKISEAFKERLDAVRKIIDEDKYRRRVLTLCQQAEPRSFEDYSSSGSFRKLEKFESSTYSEVLKAIDLTDNNRPVVMKIMRALSKGLIKKLPASAIKGSQAYNDILNEIVVVQALSQLHDGVLIDGKLLYKTHFFCLINEIKVVTGHLDRVLSKGKEIHPGEKDNNNNKAENNQNDAKQQQENTKDDNSKAKNNHNQHAKADKEREKEKDKDKEKDREKDKEKEEQEDMSEEDRMLMEALPREYVVSVMRHDGHPLWWMMSHKKLSAEQLASILVQTIVGIAIAEKVYQYEHRDLHVSNILIKKTSQVTIPFVLESNRFKVITQGVKATIIDATFSRLTHNNKVYFRDLTSTLRAYNTKKPPVKMSLQNRSYREMVNITNNKWDSFCPKTNLIWLTYLCETMMKNEVLKANQKLHNEVKKIRDHTAKSNTTIELLNYFPFEKDTTATSGAGPTNQKSTFTSKIVSKMLSKFVLD